MQEKFPSDPRKRSAKYGSETWEEVTKTEERAEKDLDFLEGVLKSVNFELKEDSKVLDVGSGKGLFMEAAKKRGMNIVGVDARPRGPGTEPQVAARIEQLPFADATFDLALSTGIFDKDVYLQDQKTMLEEIARVLKPGGIYIGSGAGREAGPPKGFRKLIPGGAFWVYKKT